MKSKGKKISAAEFKAKWMPILDELGPERIVILKRGRAVARLKTISGRRKEGLVGLMKGKIAVQGGIFSTGAKWNAQSRMRSAPNP